MSKKPSDKLLEIVRLEHGLLQILRSGYWYTLPVQNRYTIDGRQVSGARLHWYLHYGAWPDHRVYFADGDQLNYAKTNLVRSLSGGGGTRTKPYQAVCRDSTGRARHLGYYLTLEDRDAALATFKSMRAAGIV